MPHASKTVGWNHLIHYNVILKPINHTKNIYLYYHTFSLEIQVIWVDEPYHQYLQACELQIKFLGHLHIENSVKNARVHTTYVILLNS